MAVHARATAGDVRLAMAVVGALRAVADTSEVEVVDTRAVAEVVATPVVAEGIPVAEAAMAGIGNKLM